MKFRETTRKGKPVYFIDGREVTKEIFDDAIEQARPKVTPRPAKLRALKRGYPYDSMALCVHPDDVKKKMAVLEKMGVPTEFRKNGAAVIRDAAHRRALMKAEGVHDRNSYNGY